MKFLCEGYSSSLIEEMKPLWMAHWREIAFYRDIPLDPNLDVYEAATQRNGLRIYTARQSGSLIGYQVFFVQSHPHYQQSIQAIQDILFISRSQRRGLVGYKFLQWCDAQLKKEGVQVVVQHVKVRLDFSALLERIGYEKLDTLYARRLN